MSKAQTKAVEVQETLTTVEWLKFQPLGIEPTPAAEKKPPTPEAWAEIMERMNDMTLSIPWWRVDLYLLGEAWFGEDFATAVFDPVLWDIKTWQNNVSVGRRIPLKNRRPLPVTFSHHAEVAYLPEDEQARWLDRVEKEGLTVSELRQRLREDKAANEGKEVAFVTGGTLDRLRKLHKSAIKLQGDMSIEDMWGDVVDIMDRVIDDLADALEIAAPTTKKA